VLVRIRLLTRFAAQGLAEIPEMLQTQAVMRPHLKETFMPRIRRVSVASLAMLLLLLAPIQTVAAGSSPRCATPPGPGVDLHGCDLSGATLRIDLQGINLARADLTGADFHKAKGLSSVVWSDTTCVDGTNSDTNGGTCVGHLG
jgi:hypothetical protein